MQFHIQNMTCSGCVRGVANAILSVDAAARINADPASRKVHVVSEQPRAVLESALAKAGYSVAALEKKSGCCCG
jgi:copper chaperone